MKQLTSLTAFVLLANSLLATTYYVDASRPDDTGNGLSWGVAKKTIQAAVDATLDGDTVLVTNGVYNTGATITPGFNLYNRVVITKNITVKSVNGQGNTFIEGSGSEYYGTVSALRCVYMNNGILEGFTLRKGSTFDSTQFGDTHPNLGGGGVYSAGCDVKNCVMIDNQSYNGGGAYGGNLYNCLIVGNSAIYGGGSYGSTLFNCTVSANNAYQHGGGSYGGVVKNSILYTNTSSLGGTANYHTSASFVYSCTTPLPSGLGNISSDPKFISSATSNYRLQVGSPCRNTGTNEYVQSSVDLAGNPRIAALTVDMGAYEFDYAYDLGLPVDSVLLCGTAPGVGFQISNNIAVIKGSLMGHGVSSGFTFSAQDEGRLTFRWNVSSEYYFDTLNFYVDNVLTAEISGKNVTWASVTNTVLTVGPHTFKWEYSKDIDTSVGQDCAWVSDVVWMDSKTSTPIPVPYVWLDQYPTLLALAGGDYDAAALADVDGDGHTGMQEYVTGSIPTNRASILRALINMVDGNPRITWTPDLGAQRIYTIDGKTNLIDAAWHSPTNAGSTFFKVKAEML